VVWCAQQEQEQAQGGPEGAGRQQQVFSRVRRQQPNWLSVIAACISMLLLRLSPCRLRMRLLRVAPALASAAPCCPARCAMRLLRLRACWVCCAAGCVSLTGCTACAPRLTAAASRLGTLR
jgi:hypothetical protein